jgi:hypothetical protein
MMGWSLLSKTALLLLLLALLDLMDGSPDQTLILATSLFRELL